MTLSSNLPPSTLEALASKLEQDIRRRGLRQGDRYLTAAEASKLFSVSPITVSRAMQLLADSGVLTRQRSRGTFIGPKFQNENLIEHGIDVLRVMMAMDYRTSQPDTTDAFVNCIERALPGAVVHVQFLPEATALMNVERTVRQMEGSDAVEGLVLIRSSRQAQLCVADSGLPAVVMGVAYPGVTLSSIKHDQAMVGQLLAEYAIRENYSRFMLLTRNEWRSGDNTMLDFVSQTLAAADISLTGLAIRSIPQETAFVEDAVVSALHECDEPVIFLCRTEYYAMAALEAAEAAGRQLGVDFDVISGSHRPPVAPARYARVESQMTLGQQVEGLIKLLLEKVGNPNSSPRAVTIPVAFQEPDRD